MQIKVTTDYAIRIVLYTATVKKRVSARELSLSLGIPLSMVHKLGKQLSDHGFVDVTTGVQGGFLLARDPEKITLLQILNLFEPTTKLNRCLEEDKYCSRFATETCPVRNAYCRMQREIEEELGSVTIAGLIHEPARLGNGKERSEGIVEPKEKAYETEGME